MSTPSATSVIPGSVVKPMGFADIPVFDRVLLLQGPMGPFFADLARFFKLRGSRVVKVNFNAGDDHFYKLPDTLHFREHLSEWPAYFEEVLIEQRIDAIFLFGNCRSIHSSAIQIAQARGLRVFVFEEGYFRPQFITLEESGVNANSPLLEMSAEQVANLRPGRLAETADFHRSFSCRARQAFIYFCFGLFLAHRYPHYRHHKPFELAEAFRWLLAGARKWLYALTERRTIDEILQKPPGQYFLLPLQVGSDHQIEVHSQFGCMAELIEKVMRSFAKGAEADASLVIKHHPMERGHTHYGALIKRLAHEMGLSGRIHYIHDGRMPDLIKRARGVVVANSTTAMQSCYYGIPVIALSKAFYSNAGFTFQGGLDSFWTARIHVDHQAFMRFRTYVISKTQINFCFHAGKIPVRELRRMSSVQPPVAQEVQPRPEPALRPMPVPVVPQPQTSFEPVFSPMATLPQPMMASRVIHADFSKGSYAKTQPIYLARSAGSANENVHQSGVTLH
jgi:capsular polysaccharide export protein